MSNKSYSADTHTDANPPQDSGIRSSLHEITRLVSIVQNARSGCTLEGMSDLFNFTFVPVTKPLHFVATELLAQKQWDNVFYQGDLDSENTDEIRCLAQCPHCYKSWFNVGFRDFDAHKISDLVRDGFLSAEDISNYHIAEIVALGDFVIYKTALGATAHYVAVVCKKCSTKHLLVLGITEIQPTRYAGALQGIWLVRD